MKPAEPRTPRMRALKQQLKAQLLSPDWKEHLHDIAQTRMAAVGPLMALLPMEELLRHRAAMALAVVVQQIEQQHPEDMRTIMRRLMWHMNEESGNIGWGIPEAFGEIISVCPQAAREFHRILISYIIELEKDDNFCDHDILRRSCYWAIGRFAQGRPELAEAARPWLRKGIATDRDLACRGMAAWALGTLKPNLDDTAVLRRLAESDLSARCTIFSHDALYEKSIQKIAHDALSTSFA